MRITEILIFILCLGFITAAQSNSSVDSVNQLRVDFIDVVSRKPLDNLYFILIANSDTSNIYVESPHNLNLDLKDVGNYSCQVIKNGYETLILEFQNTNEPTEHILEFYLPRKDLSKDEKKEAHRQSVNLPEPSDELSGGFQKVKVTKNEFIVLRYRAYLDGSSTKEHEFRKVRTCKSSKNPNSTQKAVGYSGGRIGFSACHLKLYEDSTYYWREWTHAGLNLNDTGTWSELNGHFYLQSAIRRKQKATDIIRFEAQEFTVNGDTLRLIPKDPEEEDYYSEYFTLMNRTDSTEFKLMQKKLVGCWRSKNYQFKYEINLGSEYKSRVHSSAPIFKLVLKDEEVYLEWIELTGGENYQRILSLTKNKLTIENEDGIKAVYKRNKNCSSLIKGVK